MNTVHTALHGTMTDTASSSSGSGSSNSLMRPPKAAHNENCNESWLKTTSLVKISKNTFQSVAHSLGDMSTTTAAKRCSLYFAGHHCVIGLNCLQRQDDVRRYRYRVGYIIICKMLAIYWWHAVKFFRKYESSIKTKWCERVGNGIKGFANQLWLYEIPQNHEVNVFRFWRVESITHQSEID